MRHPGRGFARSRLCDLFVREVASRIRHTHSKRRLADRPRLRTVFRHADWLRQFLSAGHSDAWRAGRIRRSRGTGFFYTDAIAAEAVRFIETAQYAPLFLYTAFTAPHWPLHAKPADIARYKGVFDRGWDVLRVERMQQLIAEGILPANTTLSARDPSQPAWTEAADQAWQAYRMQVYAAQIEALDRGVGRIVEALQNAGKFENTLFMFLSDNGASAEELPLFGEARFSDRTDIVPRRAKDGSRIRIGNTPDISPVPTTPMPATARPGPISPTRRFVSTNDGCMKAASQRR